MVWIHGGGFCIGAGSEAWFNASNLAAAEDVIVVTLNYRLGALGFMVLDGVPGTLGNGGMNGVNDQIVALRWVQAHAAAFGGDPSRVTIFGESSGGTSVCLLSVAPAARGLFERSIQQSGPCVGPWAPSASLGRSITAQIKKSLNASTEDLRRAPAEDVQWPDTYMSDLKIAPYFSAVFVDQGGGAPRHHRRAVQQAVSNCDPGSHCRGHDQGRNRGFLWHCPHNAREQVPRRL